MSCAVIFLRRLTLVEAHFCSSLFCRHSNALQWEVAVSRMNSSENILLNKIIFFTLPNLNKLSTDVFRTDTLPIQNYKEFETHLQIYESKFSMCL